MSLQKNYSKNFLFKKFIVHKNLYRKQNIQNINSTKKIIKKYSDRKKKYSSQKKLC